MTGPVPQLELFIDALVLDGVPLSPGLAAEVEAELGRLFATPEGAQALAALHGGPGRRDIAHLQAGAVNLQPGCARLGISMGRAIYQTLGGGAVRGGSPSADQLGTVAPASAAPAATNSAATAKEGRA